MRYERATITLPLPVTRPESWSEDAACARPGANPAWFDAGHDDETLAARRNRHALAKAVCARCPVVDACRDAIVPGDSGVRAGKVIGERERTAPVRKAPKPINHGTSAGAKTHWERGESPCEPCRIAANARLRAQRAKKKAS